MKFAIILTILFLSVNLIGQDNNTKFKSGVFYYASFDTSNHPTCGTLMISNPYFFSKTKLVLKDTTELSKLIIFIVDCPGSYGEDFFKYHSQYVIEYEKISDKSAKKDLFEFQFFKSKGVKFYKAIKIIPKS